MRPLVRSWILLPIAAIIFVAGLFWAREQARESKKNPVVRAQEGVEKSFGMKLETQTAGGNGLKVLAVRPGSPADGTGIKVGDVVVAIGERSVWHAYGFADQMTKQLEATGRLFVLVNHNGEYRSVMFGSRKAMQAAGGMPGRARGVPGRAPGEPGGAPRGPGGSPPPTGASPQSFQ